MARIKHVHGRSVQQDTSGSLDAPAADCLAISPSNTTVIDPSFRGLYVGVSGNISITTLAGNQVTLSNVPVGIIPVCGTQVRATGATASGIVGLF